jgi:quercetin dioxygenase-like cupin family protein
MKRVLTGGAVAAAVVGLMFGLSRGGADEPAGHGDGHVMVMPDALKWAPNPVLPPGAFSAVVFGDPKKAGEPYVIRAKLPDGFKVPNHWHPSDEHVTVLAGTLMLGMGERFDPAPAKALPTGSFARMPKGVRHFAFAKGETVVQVHGTGPFDFVYVNPADDPRKNAK